ncbi:MAG: glycosyltransferase family 4 protein [Candidatus Saccharicenans sp.]|nr:glycosyltransferase family 4 protein [Candidatus Saccharicenans sp.]MDI6848903.1 glycosyltransferase family 4 protein [Candidatus Saccharicenans sp.]
MKQVFLFHAGKIQHYRIGVYNYLHNFLKKHGYFLTIISEGLPSNLNLTINFPEIELLFSFRMLAKLVRCQRPWANILFINHREKYFYPFLLYLRLRGNKAITWTHGINFQKKSDRLSRIAHHLEHALCHRIILYSEEIKKYLLPGHRQKAFAANNTLNLTDYIPDKKIKEQVLNRYNIFTKKNIAYSGSFDERKRLLDLMNAFENICDEETGLILIGNGKDKTISERIKNNRQIFYLGPLYGKEVLDVLTASDVCCIPGAVGLGIVDSMYCGLPLVTENVDQGPEIMYFKEGVNGFMVPKGDIIALSEKLRLLIKNDELRERMSQNARNEILTNGHIDNLCNGFLRCLRSLENKD